MSEFSTSTRINEHKVCLAAFEHVNVQVNYFWDSHGKLVNWNDATESPTSWTDAKVEIYRYSFTECLLGKTFDFQTDQLYINDKIISGDLFNYNKETDFDSKTTLTCSVIVGWG